MKQFSRFAVVMFVIAGVSGAISVAAAAFADHALGRMVADGERAVRLFKEASALEMNHALALILTALLAERVGPGTAQKIFRTSAVLMALGAILFPTAIYSSVFGGPGFWAPFGGIAAQAGWLILAVAAVLSLRQSSAS